MPTRGMVFQLADLFLLAYEADFLQVLIKNKDRKIVQTFNSSVRDIDGVLSLHEQFSIR